jgi:EmrB/QacA subfamily drug resistance transporter
VTGHEAQHARQHHNITLAALTFAGIAFALQQTMVVPALTTLRTDLHTSTTWATWVLTGFMLVAAVSTPVMGKLGDQYGKERLLLISLLVLFLGCVLAVFAWDIWSLIGARAIQGIGGAVFPLSFGIIRDEFPPEKVGTAVGIVSSVFAIGGGLGLVLSGIFIDYLSWRWLFIAGSIGVGIAVVLVHRFVPESPVKTASRIDVPGVLLLSLGLTALLLGLTEGEPWGWTSAPTIGLFVLSALAFWAWVAVERRVPDPLIDLRMFVRRPVLVTNVTAVLVGFSMFGTFVLIPNFLETPPSAAAYGFGASSMLTGLYLLPSSLSGLLGGPLAGRLGRRHSSKFPLALGLGISAVGIAMLALWHDEGWQIVLGVLVWGIGPSMAFAAMAKLIVDSVRPTETGVAGGMNTVMRTIGGVIGGQAGAAILTADTIAGTHVPAESAYTIAFAMAAAVAAVATVFALFVTPTRLRSRAVAAFQGE